MSQRYPSAIAASATPGRRRRTQAERRAETRSALLDATIECLVTYGYSQTTTGRIAELAGVSRGAQTMYFRTRAELVVAAVTHLADERVKAVSARFGEGPVTTEHALDVLYEEHRSRLFRAGLELWIASRTDPELAKTLHRAERDVADRLGELAVQALGETARRPGFKEDLVVVLATIRGLALLAISNEEGKKLSEYWLHTRAWLVPLLAPPD
ncbi:MAG: TetR/AcrR family transcriptional regulator [Solirubrobacterales bacterium]|nr:TetR/AcrR family transcriptional regulator [Solirubrobacterales bacterium]MCB8971055.1 TetR/AcrR family transcriptional regulator [Thermoleophilales bacterium]MCO5326051.1 TetR/AcrR family transcriptional regulator [Solirubrobacterales bacterium]